ncbi:DUF1801 domain-containing protein, partial [Staphylococcus aureus]|uniref:DUF1801 domain-containing protein n=1 Tax=Staphylococcus aureus TaxID=1280 RepID=UPI000D274CE6
MSEKQSNEQVEAFLNKESQWQEEYKYLRALIFNETELEEAYKWMHPCYTLNNKNASTCSFDCFSLIVITSIL